MSEASSNINEALMTLAISIFVVACMYFDRASPWRLTDVDEIESAAEDAVCTQLSSGNTCWDL